MTRPQKRLRNWELAKRTVNDANLRQFGDGHYRGMPRRERRQLSRAYCARFNREDRVAAEKNQEVPK